MGTQCENKEIFTQGPMSCTFLSPKVKMLCGASGLELNFPRLVIELDILTFDLLS